MRLLIKSDCLCQGSVIMKQCVRYLQTLCAVLIVSGSIFRGGEACAADSANLLTNGGFETGTLDGWTNGGFGGLTTTNPLEGRFCASSSGVGTGRPLMQQVSVKPGTDYCLSGWVKNTGNEGVGLAVKFDGHPLQWAFRQTEIDGKWTFVSKVFNSGNATTATVGVYRRQGPGGFADDVRFVEGGSDPGAHEREERRFDTPRVALVQSSFDFIGYAPGREWEEDMTSLCWRCDTYKAAEITKRPDGKVKIGDTEGFATGLALAEGERALLDRLADYDMVVFSAMYTHDTTVFWNDIAEKVRKYLHGGGMVLVTKADNSQAIGWLRNVNPAFALETTPCPNGLPVPETISETLRVPHPLEDGLFANSWPINRIPRPRYPEHDWSSLLCPRTGEVLITNRDGQALLWRAEAGKGTLVVTTLFKHCGMNDELIENLWAAHVKRLGRPYQPRPSRPTIAEELDAIEAKAGRNRPTNQPAPSVRVDQNLILRVDDTPFFPNGMYLAYRPESLRLIGEAGFNSTYRVTPTPEMTAIAEKYGLKFISRNDYSVEAILSDRDGFAAQRANRLVIAHDAWEEPSSKRWFTSRHAKAITAAVKRMSPGKPVGHLVVSTVEHAAYGGFGDFWACDPYTVRGPDSSLNRISTTLDNMYRLHPGKPAWAVLQAFAQPPHWAMPTEKQLRAQLCLALVHGAKGIFWFAMDAPKSTRKEAAQVTFIRYPNGEMEAHEWEILKTLARETNAMMPWLAGEMRRVETSDDRLHAAVWRRADSDDRMLIIVNLTSAEFSAKIDTGNASLNLLRPLLNDSASFAKVGSGYRFELNRYDVGVYTVR